MSSLSRKALQGGAVLLFLLMFVVANISAYSGTATGNVMTVLTVAFFIVLLALVLGFIAKAAKPGGPRIQRPLNGQTAFPPPPPPDTILVVCPYCNASQPFKERCTTCGGPLPKPGLY